jgi:hypothetical protein
MFSSLPQSLRGARLSWTKICAALAILLLPSVVFAQKPVTVHVIALDSDDASEDQADALTSALRVRVRNTPSLQLAESNQSLATLLPALKCPARPDSACLQKIGDQLKTDRFFWGNVVKAPTPHQVVAEVHLWTRGKPEQVAKESFSDNLKDQNDDALKRVASALFEHLTGQATQGVVLVHANGAAVGTVIVDGKPAGQLAGGQATVQLPSGSHTVDVQVDGMSTTPQNVNIVVNVQSELTFDMRPLTTAPVTPSKPSHLKKTIGFITLAVAGGSAVAAAIFGGLYANDSSQFNTFRQTINPSFTQPCSNNVQNQNLVGVLGLNAVTTGCGYRNSADTEGSLAWTLGGVAVGLAIIGVVLVVTDHPNKEEGSPAPAARFRILPTFGPGGGGMAASLTF